MTIDGGGLQANIGTIGLIGFENQSNTAVTGNLNAAQIDARNVNFDNFNTCDEGCRTTF